MSKIKTPILYDIVLSDIMDSKYEFRIAGLVEEIAEEKFESIDSSLFKPRYQARMVLSGKTCQFCGEEFTKAEWNDRHWPHEEDCPNFSQDFENVTDEVISCDCAIECHAHCCPDKNCEDKSE